MAARRLLRGLCLASSFFLCAAYNPDDQIGADIDYGTFANPSVHVRPRFRYWIPDASVNLSVVAEDYRSAKKVGVGGLELLGYYLYGDYPDVTTPVPVDWTKYGWGTPAWRDLLTVALKATKENGMIMDLANGPNQGAGVPAEADNDGLMMDLWPHNVSVAIGGTFSGILPGWGSGKFVAASTGLVTASHNATFMALPDWVGPYFYNGTAAKLDPNSLQDVTSQVDGNGHLRMTFPSNSSGLHYQIFAFYQNQSGYMEQASPLQLTPGVKQSPVKTFVQNGSRLVDHFSAKGAQVVINFWEDHVLDDENRELVKEVGNYFWEDSQEFGAGTLVWWTPSLLEVFEANRGYSLIPYLPLIYSYNSEPDGPLASPNHFALDETGDGYNVLSDYWQTLTELNQIYLKTLSNWTTSSLESQFSAQVVYNLPMDMLANIPYVNAPECESLGFNHLIDGYRQFAGPANLAGKRIISSELGAIQEEAYTQTLPQMIWDTKRSIVGGVNQFIYHGFPYSGSYPNTTWPGYTTFQYMFSNQFGPRQPAWEYTSDYIDWTARLQWVVQSGVPKVDLAFWLKRDQYFAVPSVYEPNDLAEAGYSYEYLSPDNFGLPEAYVQDGIFAPNRQSFKAMIVRQNDTLTVSGVQHLVDFAQAGLPIIFSGGVPQNLTGYNTSGTAYVRSALAGIMNLHNVHVVPYESLAASLSALGITPRTSVSADRIMYTYWREDANSSTTYVVLYNDGWDSELGEGTATGSITFNTSGAPYVYDAWTGEVSPVIAYQQNAGRTIIPLTLAGNQTAIIAFKQASTSSQAAHLISAPSTVYSISNDGTTIKASNNSEPVLLSNGSTITLPATAAEMNLSKWNLTVESWTKPSDPFTDQTVSDNTNTTYQLTSLKPWNQISSSLKHVSGRGFYSTTFSWPPKDGQADGAMLNLGYIVHTARVALNGNQFPPLDPTNAVADIGDYLVKGENKVEIVVSTTLGNAMKKNDLYKTLRTSGQPWLGAPPPEQEYGLIAPVTIMPYREVVLSL